MASDKEKRDLELRELKTERRKSVDKSIADLWIAVNEAKKPKCSKEEQLKMLDQIPGMQRDLGSWKFFRTFFIGVGATLLILAITAIVAFANVQSDTKRNTEDVKEQKRNFASFKLDLDQIKTQGATQQKQNVDLAEIKESLKSLVEIKKTVKQKKKRKR